MDKKRIVLLSLLLLMAVAGLAQFSGRAVASKAPLMPKMAKTEAMWAGVVSKPEVTAYQYGTHVLEGRALDGSVEGDRTVRFALRSRSIKLERWIGKNVIITGRLVEGYPVDFGPPLIEVTAIEEDQIVSVAPEISPTPEAFSNLTRMGWRLSSYADSMGSQSGRKLKATLSFNKDGTIQGQFCNSIRGRFAISRGNKISFSNISRTKKACRGLLGQVERFLADGTYDYDITKGYLHIENASGSIFLTRKTTGRENPMSG